jgi:hypothetical protein
MRRIVTLTLAAGLFAVLAPTHSQQGRAHDAEATQSKLDGLSRHLSPLLLPRSHGCAVHEIACGQTISTNLNANACQLDDGSYIDFYTFFGQAGQTVTINMASAAFDTFLFLLDPADNIVATDDDGGGGTNSRIVHTLNQTSSDWAIGANAFDPLTTGPYTLSLQCSGQPPPPPPGCPAGFFSDPNYPDFCFRVRIGNPGSTIPGTREPNCIPETVCVSGALPGRSEAFLRIIGPRPNGYLWPTIVRFTPSRVVVDIHQRSSGETNTYILHAVPPGVDELSGLQDRTGFLP